MTTTPAVASSLDRAPRLRRACRSLPRPELGGEAAPPRRPSPTRRSSARPRGTGRARVASRAWQMSASACSVLPRPMSSARIRRARGPKATPASRSPRAGRGAARARERRRRLVLGERIEFEQRVDLALPRLRLLGDNSERGELGPEARLVAADPQRRRRRSASARASSISCAATAAGREQREVRPVLEQHVRLAACEGDEHLGERQLAPLDADRHAEVEPVALSHDLRGGEADLSDSPTSR